MSLPGTNSSATVLVGLDDGSEVSLLVEVAMMRLSTNGKVNVFELALILIMIIGGYLI